MERIPKAIHFDQEKLQYLGVEYNPLNHWNGSFFNSLDNPKELHELLQNTNQTLLLAAFTEKIIAQKLQGSRKVQRTVRYLNEGQLHHTTTTMEHSLNGSSVTGEDLHFFWIDIVTDRTFNLQAVLHRQNKVQFEIAIMILQSMYEALDKFNQLEVMRLWNESHKKNFANNEGSFRAQCGLSKKENVKVASIPFPETRHKIMEQTRSFYEKLAIPIYDDDNKDRQAENLMEYTMRHATEVPLIFLLTEDGHGPVRELSDLMNKLTLFTTSVGTNQDVAGKVNEFIIDLIWRKGPLLTYLMDSPTSNEIMIRLGNVERQNPLARTRERNVPEYDLRLCSLEQSYVGALEWEKTLYTKIQITNAADIMWEYSQNFVVEKLELSRQRVDVFQGLPVGSIMEFQNLVRTYWIERELSRVYQAYQSRLFNRSISYFKTGALDAASPLACTHNNNVNYEVFKNQANGRSCLSLVYEANPNESGYKSITVTGINYTPGEAIPEENFKINWNQQFLDIFNEAAKQNCNKRITKEVRKASKEFNNLKVLFAKYWTNIIFCGTGQDSVADVDFASTLAALLKEFKFKEIFHRIVSVRYDVAERIAKKKIEAEARAKEDLTGEDLAEPTMKQIARAAFDLYEIPMLGYTGIFAPFASKTDEPPEAISGPRVFQATERNTAWINRFLRQVAISAVNLIPIDILQIAESPRYRSLLQYHISVDFDKLSTIQNFELSEAESVEEGVQNLVGPQDEGIQVPVKNFIPWPCPGRSLNDHLKRYFTMIPEDKNTMSDAMKNLGRALAIFSNNANQKDKPFPVLIVAYKTANSEIPIGTDNPDSFTQFWFRCSILKRFSTYYIADVVRAFRTFMIQALGTLQNRSLKSTRDFFKLVLTILPVQFNIETKNKFKDIVLKSDRHEICSYLDPRGDRFKFFMKHELHHLFCQYYVEPLTNETVTAKTNEDSMLQYGRNLSRRQIGNYWEAMTQIRKLVKQNVVEFVKNRFSMKESFRMSLILRDDGENVEFNSEDWGHAAWPAMNNFFAGIEFSDYHDSMRYDYMQVVTRDPLKIVDLLAVKDGPEYGSVGNILELLVNEKYTDKYPGRETFHKNYPRFNKLEIEEGGRYVVMKFEHADALNLMHFHQTRDSGFPSPNYVPVNDKLYVDLWSSSLDVDRDARLFAHLRKKDNDEMIRKYDLLEGFAAAPTDENVPEELLIEPPKRKPSKATNGQANGQNSADTNAPTTEAGGQEQQEPASQAETQATATTGTANAAPESTPTTTGQKKCKKRQLTATLPILQNLAELEGAAGGAELEGAVEGAELEGAVGGAAGGTTRGAAREARQVAAAATAPQQQQQQAGPLDQNPMGRAGQEGDVRGQQQQQQQQNHGACVPQNQAPSNNQNVVAPGQRRQIRGGMTVSGSQTHQQSQGQLGRVRSVARGEARGLGVRGRGNGRGRGTDGTEPMDQ